jgi:hypothetical protein
MRTIQEKIEGYIAGMIRDAGLEPVVLREEPTRGVIYAQHFDETFQTVAAFSVEFKERNFKLVILGDYEKSEIQRSFYAGYQSGDMLRTVFQAIRERLTQNL